MALPEYSLKDLLESGVHFGHQTHRWNPLMQEYIYGARNGIHIIDLTQTFNLLDVALNYVQDTVSKGGSILFVGTKRQAQKPIAEAAERSAQYYMNHRWLGGTLTNWKTVSNSISRLKKLDEQLSDGASGLTKKERLNLEREQLKLNASLGGIREMGGIPDLLFVIDTNKESLAIQEAKTLGIPVIAIIDTNSDPSSIDFPIPGNDDAARSINLYCDLISKAALEGMTNQLTTAGVDIGESIDPPSENFSNDDNSETIDSKESNLSDQSLDNEKMKNDQTSSNKKTELEKNDKLRSENSSDKQIQNKSKLNSDSEKIEKKITSNSQDIKEKNSKGSPKTNSNSKAEDNIKIKKKLKESDE